MKELIEEISRNVAGLKGDSGRVFHGRGKALEGYENITVEYLSGILLVILFGERKKEWRTEFVDRMGAGNCNSQVEEILFQARYEKQAPVFDQHENSVDIQRVIQENGLRYQLHLGGSQNYGFFPDMANGRNWVKKNAVGRKVLNLFSYTCSFSVSAIEGGADQVVNVDMSSAALSVGRSNHQLNGHSLDKVSFQKLNILKSWGRINRLGPYDLVIIDPPSFQKGSFSVVKDYRKVVKRLAEMTTSEADVLFCLNDPLITIEEFQGMLESDEFRFVSRIENPSVMKEVQQDVGLKVLHYHKTS